MKSTVATSLLFLLCHARTEVNAALDAQVVDMLGRRAKGSSKSSKSMSLSGKLITPTLWAVYPHGLACNLCNVSGKTRLMRTRIIHEGEVLKDTGIVSIDHMHTHDIYVEGLPDGGPIYCEFSFEGSKGDFRGAVKLFELPNSSDFTSLPAT